MRRRDWLGIAVALALAALCVRLGVWQLDRLAQRRSRNAEIRAARERPALALERAGLAADAVRNRRILAQGLFDYARERVWRGRTFEGTPGVHLITPLRLADGSAVLVDRGWVPSPDASTVQPLAYREADSARVEGLGAVAPRGRGDVDPEVLADSFPYPLLPFVIQALPSGRPAARAPAPDRRGPGPVRAPPPALTDGPHLSYAIQWFSFAVIIVVGTLALLRSRARARGGGGAGGP